MTLGRVLFHTPRVLNPNFIFLGQNHRVAGEENGHFVHVGGGVHCPEGDGQNLFGEVDEQAFGEKRMLRQAETAEEGPTGSPFHGRPLRRNRQLQRHRMAF